MFLQAIIFGLLTITCAYSFSNNLDQHWYNYKIRFRRNYNNEENSFRRKIWERAVNKIVHHNLEADLKIHSYRLGLNQFTDMTNKEYLTLLKMRKTKNNYTCLTSFLPHQKTHVPNKMDWRIKGIVPTVKDQGPCGSVSVMATVSCMEAQNAKKTGKLVSLSEQNLLDCCGPQGGCEGGGSIEEYFLCIEKMGGIDSATSYPTGKEGDCHFNKSGVAAKCRGCVFLPSGNEDALKIAVATVGPIATYVDASNLSFQLYSGGVYDDPTCSSSELDHAMLIVGYGTEEDKDYWLLQNSWGASWGMNGYIKMSRNKGNQCGIATAPIYPLV